MAVLDDAAKQKAEFFKQKRAEQLGQVAAQGQEQQDAIQRRFASLGAQGSGAQFGVAQKAQEAQAAQARQAQTDIMGQEIAAAEPDLARRFQAEQTKLGQEYGTSERLGQEKFAGEQAGLGRQFQTQERQAGQQFAGEQAQLGREFTSAERLAQQAYGSDEAGKQRQFQAGQQVLQNEFASGQASLGRQFTSEEQAKQNQFLSGQSAASRELQSRLAADDLALKKSIADMQQANTKEELAMAAQQFRMDKETTDFNKYVSLVTMGFSRADAQSMAFSNVGPSGPLPGSQAAAQSPGSISSSIASMQPITGLFGVPSLPPMPENATQQERFEYQKKQEALIDNWVKTNPIGNINIGMGL